MLMMVSLNLSKCRCTSCLHWYLWHSWKHPVHPGPFSLKVFHDDDDDVEDDDRHTTIINPQHEKHLQQPPDGPCLPRLRLPHPRHAGLQHARGQHHNCPPLLITITITVIVTVIMIIIILRSSSAPFAVFEWPFSYTGEFYACLLYTSPSPRDS